MKFTQILFKQHLARMIRNQWHVKQERKIGITYAEKNLSALGFKVKDPIEILKPKKVLPRYFIFHIVFFAKYVLHVFNTSNYMLYQDYTRTSIYIQSCIR